MALTPCALRSLTRAVASDSATKSLVTSSIGAPSTPPSVLTRSRAIGTPAYCCFASGAWGPLKGKMAPTLMLAVPPADGAVAHAAQARTTPMAASCRSRTGAILDITTQPLRDPFVGLSRRPQPFDSLTHGWNRPPPTCQEE